MTLSRDNDEEALLSYIENEFVFDQNLKKSNDETQKENLDSDEFLAKVTNKYFLFNLFKFDPIILLFCFLFFFPINLLKSGKNLNSILCFSVV